MIRLAAVWLQVAAPAATPESNVVVTARALGRLEIVMKRQRGGGYYCKYKRRSGDNDLDSAACTVAIGCYEQESGRKAFIACTTTALTALVKPKT